MSLFTKRSKRSQVAEPEPRSEIQNPTGKEVPRIDQPQPGLSASPETEKALKKSRLQRQLDVRVLAMGGLMTALVFVFTFSLKIPSVTQQGYVHAGDAFVLLSGILLGPLVGFISAAMGSALADLIGGYFIFIPATLVIKGLEAVLAYLIYTFVLHLLDKERSSNRVVALIVAALPASAFMVFGYFLYESLIFNPGTAIANILGNVGQAVTSIVLAALLVLPLGLIVRSKK